MKKGRDKKRYNVTLDVDSAEKVIKLLHKCKLTLSGFMTVLVNRFAEIVDETGFSEKLENLTISEGLVLMSQIMQGIEVEQKEIKKVEKKHSK